MNPAFAEYGLKDLLPLKLDIPDEGCTRPNASMYCFEAGNYHKTFLLKVNNEPYYRGNSCKRAANPVCDAHSNGQRT